MVEQATLKLDSGDELRVEVEREDLKRDEIVVRRKGRSSADILMDVAASRSVGPALPPHDDLVAL